MSKEPAKRQHNLTSEVPPPIRIDVRESKDAPGHYEYHVYMLEVDDFGNESWAWVAKSGINEREERYVQRSTTKK